MDYYTVLADDGSLFGIYEYQFDDDGMMEIGLGIRPADTGKGHGAAFVEDCIAFGRSRYAYAGPVVLRVASFNSRAIYLYTKLGFVETGRQQAVSYGTPVEFVVMQRDR